jgi:hypothetical protein|tara:strand:+ start:540 stop:689 length:150 start_codon:yes stop_codon:yes gene_type:complete
MDDSILDFDDFNDLDLDNEFVKKSHIFAEKLKKKGFNIKELKWKNYKAS